MVKVDFTYCGKYERMLIIDGGSTKMEWVYICRGKETKHYTCGGLNPMVADESLFLSTFADAKQELGAMPDFIGYYGAGCATMSVCTMIKNVIFSVFGADISAEVGSDMLLAAKSAGDVKEAIVVILGTGSNSCHYDGKECITQVSSLGYLLGDEGSGSYIGKRLLRDILRERAPENIIKAFQSEIGITYSDILENVYRGDTPAKFLASMMPFTADHLTDSYMSSLVEKCISDFFDEIINAYNVRYPHLKDLVFVGSVAYHFESIVKRVASQRGYNVVSIVKKPLDSIIETILNERKEDEKI